MDHLGIQKFFYMGYCIGGCFAGLKLIERAPDRVVAAVLCQTSAIGRRIQTSCTTPAAITGPPNCAPDGPR